jgi:anaerobic glycerol-3-phosphate dehydrogenase
MTNGAPNLTQPNSRATGQNNSNDVQILKNSSFIDSSGTMHVVGEVRNNLPSTAVFVTIVGTFYDFQNDVVATQFTYTKPTDIESGQKASFEIIVTSASVPIPLIDHYKLQINYE